MGERVKLVREVMREDRLLLTAEVGDRLGLSVGQVEDAVRIVRVELGVTRAMLVGKIEALAVEGSRRARLCECENTPVRECPTVCQRAVWTGAGCPKGAWGAVGRTRDVGTMREEAGGRSMSRIAGVRRGRLVRRRKV